MRTIRAFTLVEAAVTLVVIGILAAVTTQAVNTSIKQAKGRTGAEQLRQIEGGKLAWLADHPGQGDWFDGTSEAERATAIGPYLKLGFPVPPAKGVIYTIGRLRDTPSANVNGDPAYDVPVRGSPDLARNGLWDIEPQQTLSYQVPQPVGSGSIPTTDIPNIPGVPPKFTLTLLVDPSIAGTTTGAGLYETGATASFAVTGAQGWQFNEWRDEGGHPFHDLPAGSLVMVADRTLTARFSLLPRHHLDVHALPPEGGTTTGSGDYDVGASASYSQSPNSGWVFTGWSGDASGEEAQGTTLMDRDKTIVANYLRNFTLEVTAEPADAGTITGAGTYRAGTEATYAQTPNSGWSFTGWSGDVSGMNPSGTITMDDNKAIVAHYQPRQFPLSVEVNPPQGGTPWGGGSFAEGSTANFGVTPAEGWSLDSWSGDYAGTTATGSVVLNGPKVVVANMVAENSHTLTVVAVPSDGASTTGSGTYADQTTATFGFSPKLVPWTGEPYYFQYWMAYDASGSYLGYGYDLTGSILMDRNITVYGYLWAPPESVYIDVSVYPPEAGTATGGGTYPYGSAVNIATTPSGPDWTFDHWEGYYYWGTSPQDSFIAYDDDYLVAYYTAPPAHLKINVVPGNAVASEWSVSGYGWSGGYLSRTSQGSAVSVWEGNFTKGDRVSINISPASSLWFFDRWEGDIASADLYPEVLMDRDKEATVYFVAPVQFTYRVNPPNAGRIYFPQGDDFWNPGITYTQNTASAYYKTGRGVGLQATALAGYHFVGWSGDVASTEEFLGLVADADKSLVANFEADPPPPTERQLVVNVVPAEGGTGTGGGTFPWSTTSRSVDVTLAAGFSFQYWEGYVSNSTSKYTTAYLPDAVNVVTAHLLNQTLDLSVIKSVDVSSVRVGESVTFTLGVERSGDYNGGIASHDFSNVKLVDTMPEGLTVTAVRVPAGGSYSLNGRVLSVTLPSVPTTVQPGYGFGGGARVEIDAVANTPGRKSNVVVLSAPEDSNDSNNTASVDINVTGGADAVDLVLDKAASPTSGVISGTTLPTFTYTVSAFNAGSGPASSVVITDTMAPGAQLGAVNNPFGTHTLNGNVLSLNLGDIAPNSGNYASYTVTYATPGQKKNVAVATFSGTDENPGDNTDSVTVQVTSSGSGDGLDFSIVIKPDAVTVSRDEPASYTATITLNGNQPSSAGASATITLPEGVTLVSSELGYGYYDGYYTNQATVISAGNQVVISTGPMSGYNQSSKQYVPQVLVNFVAKSSVPGPHTIMGEVTASGDSYTANNRDDALLIVSGADLAVELDAQTPKGLGDNAQFTARVYALDLRYNGDDTDGDYFGSAYDSELTVTLPEYFNYTGCSVPPTSVNGKVLTWIIPVLAPQPWGAPGFSVDIRGTIDVDTPKEVQAITGHARISNPHPWENMNPNNDTDDATIDIIHPDWYVDIVPVDGFLKPGQTGTFNVTVGRTDDPYYGTVRGPVTASVSITGDCASASGDLNFTLPAVTYPVTRTVSVVAANVMNGKIKAVATISPPPQDMVEENNQDSAEIAVGASGPSLYFPIYQRSATYSKYGRDAYKQRPGESEIPVFRKEEVIGAFKANGSWTDAGSTVGPTGNAPGPSINRWNNSGSFDRDWQDTGTTIWLAPMNGTSYAQTQYDYRVDRDSRNFFSSQYSFNDYYWLGAGWVHEVYDTTVQQKVTTTNGVTTVGWPPSWERWKGRTWAGRSDSWVNGCPHEWVHWYEDPSWYNATTTRGQWVHEVYTYTEEWLYGPTDNRFIKTASSLSQGILTNEYTTPQLVSDARGRLSSKPWGIEQMTTWGGAGTINSSVDITLDGKTCYMYEGKFEPKAYAPGLVGWTVRIKYHLQHYSRKDSNVGGITRTVSSQHRREPSGTGNYEITATVGANGWAYFQERQIAPPVEDLQEQKGGNSASLQWVYDGIELTPP